MCREQKIKSVLYNLAQTSDCKFKHAAAVVRGSKILSTGVNNGNRTKWGNNISICLHAEMDALRLFLSNNRNRTGFDKYNKLCMWVICITNEKMIDSFGLFKKSDPCSECYANLNKYGFGKIAYTDSNGDINIVKLKDYYTEYRSNAQKRHNNYK